MFVRDKSVRGAALLTAAAAVGARGQNDCARAIYNNKDINDPIPDWDVSGVSEMHDLFNRDENSQAQTFGKQGSKDDDVSRWASSCSGFWPCP